MRAFIKKVLLIICFTLLIQSVSAETVATKQAELSHVNGQIQLLEKNIQKNKSQSMSLQQQLKIAELAIGKLSEQINRFTQELIAQQKILDELNITEQKTELQLKTQHDALAQQLRAAYQLGTQNQLKIMLNQENMNAANRHLTYYKALNEARAKLISEMQLNLILLQKTLHASELHQRTLKNLIAQKQIQQKHQQHILIIRQKLIETLGLQTQSKQQQIESLMANQQTLQETIARLKQRDITLNGQPFDQLQGKLSWPVKGQFVASFGSLLDQGTLHSNGVLIKAPMGTPVRAIYSGKVIFADWLRGFGLLIIINHGHQFMSLYARNQAIYAKPGQYIETGDVIAATGNSGGYNNPGLYFEVRQNGTPINPTIWCR